MDYYAQVVDWVQANPGVAHFIVFLVALVEAFGLTTLILPGTLFCIAFGALVFQGVLQPGPTFVAAYIGTFLGDNFTFAMSRGILSCFDRFPAISDKIRLLASPIKRQPVRFILFAHLTPYLKGLISLAAPSVLRWPQWVRLDAIATLLDTTLFLGAGFITAAVLGTLDIAEHFTLIVAVLVSIALIYWWFKGFSERHPEYIGVSRFLRLRHLIRFLVLYLPWHASRLIDLALDEASAAQTIEELEAEILILDDLVEQAKGVVASGQDRKWDELSRILQDDPNTRDSDGRLRKLIISTEHKDTLNYLHDRIAGMLGNPDAIVVIHGAVHCRSIESCRIRRTNGGPSPTWKGFWPQFATWALSNRRLSGLFQVNATNYSAVTGAGPQPGSWGSPRWTSSCEIRSMTEVTRGSSA